jgi:hypothetical protein
VGLTVKLVPVAPVFNNVYVVAPLGVITDVLPEHIVELDILDIATVGVVFTETLATAVFVQPLADVPVNV